MEDQTTPITASSEQPTVPAVVPSEPGQVTAESTIPATTAAPEPKQEPPKKEDPDAILRSVRDQARRELESEYGKKQSEAIRQVQERAVAERDALLTHLGQFIPDDELAKARQSIQAKSTEAELNYWRQKAADDAALQERATRVRGLEAIIQDAGMKWEDIPKDVVGESEVGFPERFARYTAKRLREALTDADKREKRAREEAERETEKRLGVSKMSGATPTGSGHTSLGDLSNELASAAARGDKARVSELRDAIYKEAGIDR